MSTKDIKTQIFRPIKHTRGTLGYRYTDRTLLNAIMATTAERQYYGEHHSARAEERKKAKEAKSYSNAMIIAYRNAGKTYAEIAEITGKSEKTVKTICAKKAKIDKLERDTNIMQMHTEGKSIRAIAKALSISDKTVQKVISAIKANDQTQTGGYTYDTTPSVSVWPSERHNTTPSSTDTTTQQVAPSKPCT